MAEISGQGVVLAAESVGQEFMLADCDVISGQGVVLADKRQDPTDARGYKTSQ